jgi:hypothetical protein
MESGVGKAAGDKGGFIRGGRVGLAYEVGCDATPDAAGGEDGHEAAKPDGVIHRYVFNRRMNGVSSINSSRCLVLYKCI